MLVVREESPGDQNALHYMLTSVDNLVQHGELDEALLRFLWRDTALRRIDHDRGLATLCEAGVLHELSGVVAGGHRRWVLPMRLPSVTPDGIERLWPATPRQGEEELTLSLMLRTAFVPAGLAERAVAAVLRLGESRVCWRDGALVFVPSANVDVRMELERAAHAGAGSASSSPSVSRLVGRIRGLAGLELLHRTNWRLELVPNCGTMLKALMASLRAILRDLARSAWAAVQHGIVLP